MYPYEMKPIEVLVLVDKAVPESGPHRNVVSTLNALAARSDVKIHLLCQRYLTSASFNNGKIQIQTQFNPQNSWAFLKNIWITWRASKRCDIIYVPTGLKSFLYAFFTKGSRKLVAGPNVPGIPGLMHPFNPSPLMTEKMADAWIENSPLRLKECLGGGTSPQRVSMILHSMDLEAFHPKHKNREIWKNFNIDPSHFILIHVGRWNESRKGEEVFFPSCVQILNKFKNVSVVVVGGDQEKIKNKYRNDRLFFLGPRFHEELATLYASADLFLGTSSYETFWFTPLEAMASGLPVFVSATGAVGEMISQNSFEGEKLDILTGVRFKENAVAETVEVMSRVLKDPEKLKQMGKNARVTAENKFNEKRLGEDLMKVFNKVREGAQKSH